MTSLHEDIQMRRQMECAFCGEVFRLPEDDLEENLPRVLACSHIFCTSCLLSFHHHEVIRCPECEVESTLPEGGVFALQEDCRIIGLIYTSKMNKMKRFDGSSNRKKPKLTLTKDVGRDAEATEQVDVVEVKRSVDEALARAAENLAVLDAIHETLSVGLKQQVRRERSRLEAEIKLTAGKALQAVHKWQDVQLSQLGQLDARFSCSQEEVSRVQERRKALEIAMQMAREVRRVPFLEQYCSLDKVVETLEAPVDKHSYDMESITTGSGLSFVFLSENLNQSLTLSLKMEVAVPKQLIKSPPGSRLHSSSVKKPPRPSPKVTHSNGAAPQPQIPGARGSHCPSPTPRRRSASRPGALDVVPEELPVDGQEDAAAPPTGPELANDWRIHRRKKNVLSGRKRNVAQWVVLSHVVNPSHFYVSYVAEKRQREILEKKIELFCCADGCLFGPADVVETGAVVFAREAGGLWSRARVVEVFQSGCVEAVRVCAAGRLASLRVFFLDSGFGKSLDMHGEEETAKSSLKAVNDHLRQVEEGVKVKLRYFAPQAIRCSLKDLVPYDSTKGWSTEAQLEFLSVVGSAAVEMRPMGQDQDSLLVDLRKAPVDQSSDVPISVREYLVFIEVARFYSPVNLGVWPLLFYPPKYPKSNTELSAVVSHINSPADFYIQLVDNMEFVLLSAKLQECYDATTACAEEDLTIYCPVMEQACVARYEDTLWYRARVVGHPGGRKVEVQYVDFGNKKTLPVSDLRKIKDEFFTLPSRAICCCLSGVSPVDAETWSDACRNRFIQLALQKLLTVVATGNVPKTEPLPVRLFVSGVHGPVDDIAELLVREALASFKEGALPSPSSRRLESAGAAQEFAIWDPPLDLGSAPDGGDAAPDRSSSGEKFQLRLPDQLKDVKVRVSHVNSPSSFYVQFTQNDAQLRRLCELVEQCPLMEPEEVAWKAGMFCGALVDGVWERVRLCSDAASADFTEVMRCDHGNKVKLPVGNLRPLPSSLTGSLALECTLTDIRPAGGCSTWTATACDLISFYLTGASAVLTIKEVTDEPPVPVTLFCSNKTGVLVNIADFLAGEGLALKDRKPRDAAIETSTETEARSPGIETQKDGSDGEKKKSALAPPPVSIPKPAPRTIVSAEKVKTRLYCPPELPGLGPIQMSVSAIGEDGIIYTRTENAEGLLEQLRRRIQHSMDSLPEQKPYTWKSVQGCAVLGPDMLWNRGQVLEVLGGHVKVQYVDYGLVENIPVVHVHPTLLCADVPQLSIPCQLHDIAPVGGRWQQDALALLRELLLNRCADFRVTELPSEPRRPLNVELHLDGLSLSRILCHHQHASMERGALPQEVCLRFPACLSATSVHPDMRVCVCLSLQGRVDASPALLLDDWDIDIKDLRGPEEPMLGPFAYPDLPREDERFGVRVKHLRTPNELFLWLSDGAAEVEVGGETLDGALTRVNADVGVLQPLASFRQGGPCLAEYRDGKFYRATVLEFSSVSPVCVLVQHVDFGSEDTLPTSKLRQMPADLLRFPFRALQVKVAGFKSPRASGREDMLPYSPSWSVEATMEMMNLLHGSITADIVAVEPELTMLLYDEDQQLVHLPLVSRGLADFD
ncbi:RING finger protein 17 [Spinachia spinachia]